MKATIRLGYADLLRLFNVDDPHTFAPGLELRDNGVFVAPREELPPVARGGAEEAVLTKHPSSNLAEPVLAFPCGADELEDFMEAYGLTGAIDAFKMLRVMESKAWELARVDAKETGRYYWPIVAELYALREKIERAHEAETNDGKKIVLRDVLDALNKMLPDHDSPPGYDGWPWGDYENRNLRLMAAAVRKFWEDADKTKPKAAPGNPAVAAWLQRQGVTPAAAKKIASIIRADWAPNGRRARKSDAVSGA